MSHCLYNDKRLAHTVGDGRISDGSELHTEFDQSKQDNRQGFFRHYKRHSKQLVNALKQWSEGPNTFSTCEYRDGILEIRSAVDKNEVQFMKYMMRHLEEKYPKILEFITEIETSHTEMCNKIEDIMVSDAPVRAAPSFQKIITDQIASACPTLKRSNNTSMSQDHIYLAVNVFRVVFNSVYSNESIVVFSEEKLMNNMIRLWYQNRAFALGQGADVVMKQLKETIAQLVLNSDIKKRFEQYTELHKQLHTDERVHELSDDIDYLHEYIHGGQVLDGYGACLLCPEPNISP